MNPQRLLATCTQAGVILKWDGSTIKACGEERAVSQLLPLLRSHKSQLHAYFKFDEQQRYVERAAIAEYDSGLSRADAEALALRELQAYRTNLTYH